MSYGRPFYLQLWSGVMLCMLVGYSSAVIAQDIPITTENEDAKELFIDGRELFDNIRFDEARHIFTEALQKDPEFALANIYRALTSTTDEDFVRHLSKAISVKSEVSEGERLVIESVKANSDRNPRKAVSLLEEAVTQYPNDKRLHHWLGLAYQGIDKDDKAAEQYESAIEIDPTFAAPYNNMGYMYMAQNDYQASENAFKNYIRLIPKEANPHDSIADLYTKMGQYDLAIEHYQQALDLNPKFFFSQQKIGDNLIFKGLYEDGREAYRKAIAIAPTPTNKIFIHQQMADTYLYENNFSEANKETIAAIEWAMNESLPENAAILYQRKILMDLEYEQFDEAEQDLIACSKLLDEYTLTGNRQNALALLMMRNHAIKAAKQGDFKKATKKAQKIRAKADELMNPNDMKTYYMVAGIIAFEQGNYSNAASHLKKSDPNNVYAQFYLAKTYQKSGLKAEAQALFDKVAHWNQNTPEYALVRNKALAEAKMDMAIEE